MTYEERYIRRLDMMEEEERKNKIIRGMALRDMILEDEYLDEQSRGYCPKCHCLLPLNGKCDNCD